MKEKASGRTESEKERTRETCDEVVSGFVRSTAAPSILSKALSDRPGAVRGIASEARSLMGQKERETFFPNL